MWMKVDDKLHTHRKTRRALTSDPEKRRDSAAMGLWILAGSWSGQNGTGGWIPEHELDRWDDDWEPLAHRLVKAGFWCPEERDGEAGFGFVDWEDYNPASGSSEAGKFGNHKRWHVDQGIVKPGCPHCPAIPDDIDDPDPYSGGDIGGRSGGDIAPDSQNIALPEPEPEPEPQKTCASATAERERLEADFSAWWATYPRKKGKGQAAKAYRAARKKVPADVLLAAVAQQRPTLTKDGPDFVPYPATWLNGERWEDEADAPQQQSLAGLPTIAEVRRQQAEREARERGQSA